MPDATAGSGADAEPDPPSPSFPRGMALLVAGAFFMEILDATIITPAIPAIAASFGVAAVDVNVAISAYLVTVAVLIPASGWMADRFGIRPVFIAAIAVFTLASVGCALSVSLPMLVAMRVLQGLGGAMMVPVGRLAVLRYSAKSDLVRAIALLTWPALAAPVVAPVLGGAIATVGSWRWIFFVNIPIGIIGFLFALRLIRGGRAASVRRFDWRGLAAPGWRDHGGARRTGAHPGQRNRLDLRGIRRPGGARVSGRRACGICAGRRRLWFS